MKRTIITEVTNEDGADYSKTYIVDEKHGKILFAVIRTDDRKESIWTWGRQEGVDLEHVKLLPEVYGAKGNGDEGIVGVVDIDLKIKVRKLIRGFPDYIAGIDPGDAFKERRKLYERMVRIYYQIRKLERLNEFSIDDDLER